MVLETPHEIVRAGADLHQVGDVPRTAQRNGLLAEQEVDVGGDEGLAVATDVLLLDDPDDGGVLLRERLLVGEVGACSRRHDEGEQHDAGEEDEAG